MKQCAERQARRRSLAFAREEAHRFKPLGAPPSFGSLRELTRVVGNDCAVETNSYSVPWRLIGECVVVTVAGGKVRILHGISELASTTGNSSAADHRFHPPRRCCRAQWHGLRTGGYGSYAAVGLHRYRLLGPLAEYKAAIAGSF
ncbi:Mu transposase domain-containing protein [Bradyrhizobium hereditatis]|uniref:Mu transposase domain-containing protein n=1 Tax=Bradyrhizobium hereditatis TaxID=2821405 RepID=UPI0035D80BE0